jgi:hypothetical protein
MPSISPTHTMSRIAVPYLSRTAYRMYASAAGSASEASTSTTSSGLKNEAAKSPAKLIAYVLAIFI